MKRGGASKTAATSTVADEKKRARTEAQQRRIREIEDRLREVDWRQLSFVGAELASIPGILEQPFEFPALEKELKEGVLAHRPHPVYLFMVSEPVYPRDMRTVQRAWVPYVPEAAADLAFVRGVRVPLVALQWEGRTARTKKMNEEQVHYVEYINPYILLPRLCAKLEKPEVRNVSFTWSYAGKNIDMVYDKDVDTVAEFQDDIIDRYQLTDDAKGPIKDALKDAFNKARADCDAQWTELQDRLAALSDEQKAALDSAKIYKFYPSSPDIDLTPFRVCYCSLLPSHPLFFRLCICSLWLFLF